MTPHLDHLSPNPPALPHWRAALRLPLLLYRLVRWRQLRGGWLMNHLRRRPVPLPSDRPIDVMVFFSDHFEPARRHGDAAAAEAVRSWCASYERMVDPIRDSDGRTPRHTWFYRAEYPNDGCLQALSESAFRGFGEVEFHLHHGHDSHDAFAARLRDGLAWFNRRGAMLTAEARPRQRFAYVAGNSALDNGAGDDALSGCPTELTALREAGCFADFTFPSLGSPAQPRKTNSIYYADEDGRPKSYDDGVDVQVGGAKSGELMIFQGPTAINWRRGAVDEGAWEDSSPADPARLAAWLAGHVHVRGRPEWAFVKLHTHSMQNRASFLSPGTAATFAEMVRQWTRGPYRLHFVTAREAHNVAKAAEAGLAGTPADYFDYDVPPPANAVALCDRPWRLLGHTARRTHVRIEGGGPARLEFASRGLRALSGPLREVEVHFEGAEPVCVRVEADGPVTAEPGRHQPLLFAGAERREAGGGMPDGPANGVIFVSSEPQSHRGHRGRQRRENSASALPVFLRALCDSVVRSCVSDWHPRESRMSTPWPSKLVILMPVYNDWQAIEMLLPRLDEVLRENRLEAVVLLVNDGSTEPAPEELGLAPFSAVQRVEILSLRRNVGNQRAIAIGIAHVQEQMACEALLIMDGDGEDDPADVPRLVEALHQHDERAVVFAARMKRSESWLFCTFYHLYRLVHFLLTGVAVRVGNFSIVPATYLRHLVLLPEIWNHYAAAVFKSRIPRRTIPTHRAARLAGRSRMNFVGLVAHGLSAISVFSDVVAVRLLLANGLFAVLTVLTLGASLAGVLVAGLDVPVWVYQLMGALALGLGQSLLFAVLFVMILLNGRSATNFLPERDFHYFVDGCYTIYQSSLSTEEGTHDAVNHERADVAGV